MDSGLRYKAQGKQRKDKMEDKYTDEQIENWNSFEDLRQSGACNMLSSAVREITGLTRDEHQFILANYEDMKEQAERNAA